MELFVMLDPIFFQLPPGMDDISGEYTFSLLCYCQADRYTLTRWRLDIVGNEEPIFGESLYRDRDCIQTGAGAMDFWEVPKSDDPVDPDAPSRPANFENPFNRIAANYGSYGLPQHVAIAMRDHRNYVWFR